MPKRYMLRATTRSGEPLVSTFDDVNLARGEAAALALHMSAGQHIELYEHSGCYEVPQPTPRPRYIGRHQHDDSGN